MKKYATMDAGQLKAYSGNLSKLASVVESLVKSDGWCIFLAKWEKEKKAIHLKDYKTFEEFKADRKAIEIFEGILEDFEGYISDAHEAQDLLTNNAENQTQSKGALMIDLIEEDAQEQG